eukprot:scaffold267035_cov14-Prasinocladus_malaysianus.AAC.2
MPRVHTTEDRSSYHAVFDWLIETSRLFPSHTLLVGGDMQTSPVPTPSQSIILKDICDENSLYMLNDPRTPTFPRSGTTLDHWLIQHKDPNLPAWEASTTASRTHYTDHHALTVDSLKPMNSALHAESPPPALDEQTTNLSNRITASCQSQQELDAHAADLVTLLLGHLDHVIQVWPQKPEGPRPPKPHRHTVMGLTRPDLRYLKKLLYFKRPFQLPIHTPYTTETLLQTASTYPDIALARSLEDLMRLCTTARCRTIRKANAKQLTRQKTAANRAYGASPKSIHDQLKRQSDP